MYQLIISDDARLDAIEAALWYEYQRSGLGSDFELCPEVAFNQLQRNPLHYEKRYENVRIHYIDRFPYAIHYLFEEETIKVFGIFHTRKNPSDWIERLK